MFFKNMSFPQWTLRIAEHKVGEEEENSFFPLTRGCQFEN